MFGAPYYGQYYFGQGSNIASIFSAISINRASVILRTTNEGSGTLVSTNTAGVTIQHQNQSSSVLRTQA